MKESVDIKVALNAILNFQYPPKNKIEGIMRQQMQNKLNHTVQHLVEGIEKMLRELYI